MRSRIRKLHPPLVSLILGMASALLGPWRITAQTAAATNRPMTSLDVASIKSVTAAEISPDGKHVAYLVASPRRPGVDEDGEPWSELWILDLPTGSPRPFVIGKVEANAIRWTPDSASITFLAKRGTDKFTSLYLIPAHGGEARQALSMGAPITDYSLSPTGDLIAVVAQEPDPESKKELQNKGFKQEVYEEDLRPSRVWITSLNHTSPNPRKLDVTGSISAVQFAPSGDRLAVAISPTPLMDDLMMHSQIHLVSAIDGSLAARINTPGKLGMFQWSPDSKWIAFLAGADIHDPWAGRLMLADTRDGGFRELHPGQESDAIALAWQKNQFVMFLNARGVKTEFLKAPLGIGGEARVLLKDTSLILTALSFTKDGQHGAFVAHSPWHPPELFTWNTGDQTPVRRTFNNPQLSNIRLATQEIVSFRARDGLALEGILINPLDKGSTDKRHPLIMAVHGGPESHVSHGWLTSYSLPGLVAAAKGFAVFYPNYRGSTGRGVAFSKLGQGDAAGKEFDDLIDGVDHLVGLGLVDAQRVGVTGGSYGGYATAWCATRYSERFAAGVMFVGISDKISKVGTTNIPNEEFLVHSLKRPWDDWNFLLDRSPIRFTENARTPLLILHGKDDPRVNPGQSRELFRHLKMRAKTPVRLVLYPGEGHGNKKAAAKLDYNLRMLQWFDQYLKGTPGDKPSAEIEYPK